MSVDGNETVVDEVSNDDLDAFSDAFFSPAEEEVEEAEEEVSGDADDVEDTDAEEVEGEEEADVDSEEDAEAEEEEEAEEPEPQPKKNRKTAKERIQELAQERREEREGRLEEREARLIAETRLADLEARMAKISEPEEKPAKTAVKDYDGPDPDAVDDKGELIYPLGQFDPRFNADLVKYTLRVEREAAEALAEERAEQRAIEQMETELVTDWNGKLEESTKDLPDLREKIAELEDTFVNLDPKHGKFLAETIMKLDRGPEVLYYLAENLSEAEAIVAKSPVAATLALGRLEGQLTAAPKPEGNKTKVTKAKTPPTTTRGNGAAVRTAPDTDDLEAFEREFYGKSRKV